MEPASVIKGSTESYANSNSAQMIVQTLQKEAAIKKKVNVSAKMAGKDLTALLNLVPTNAQTRVFVSMAFAFASTDSTAKTAVRRIAKIIAILTASAKMAPVFVTMVSLDLYANIDPAKTSAILKEPAEKMELANVTKAIREMIVLLLTASTTATVMASVPMENANAHSNSPVSIAQKNLAPLTVITMVYANKEPVIVKMDF